MSDPLSSGPTPGTSASGMPPLTRGLMIGGALGFVLGAFVGCGVGGGSHPSATPAQTALNTPPDTRPADGASKPAPASTPASATPAVADTPSVDPSGSWTYRETKDPMRDSVTKVACTTSTNEVRLDPPYADVSADLCIRKGARFGTDVYVHLNGDGQILCTSYEGCSVHARFDDGKAQAFSAAGASDGSSNIIFFSNANRVIPSLTHAGTTRVEIELYEGGVQQLEFDTRGLKWP